MTVTATKTAATLATNEIQVRLHRPHRGQRAILRNPARFRVVACGRRWGKTELAKIAAILAALKGKFVWWVGPTYGHATENWRTLKRTLEVVTRDKSESERRLELVTGGIIQVRSAHDPDSLRGLGLDLAVLDEAAFMQPEAWVGGIRPALSDRRGQALFLSTPNGLNWFYRLHQRGQDPLQDDWAGFHYPTGDSPLVAAREIEAARREMPERWFKQEYLAEFLEGAGAVFRNVDGVCTAQPRGERREDGLYVAGVDWARDMDYTAISVFDVQERRMVAMDRFQEISWAQQRGRLAAMYERWQPFLIWAEANSIGSVNIEALQREGLPVRPFQTTAQSKGPLIESLALAMEQDTVTLLDDPVLRGELTAYQLERLPSGMYRYNAPSGLHDDTVIATALGWYGVQRSGRAGASISFS